VSARLLVRRLRIGARLPARATPDSTGLDLYACLESPVEVGPAPVLIPTGVAIEVPPGIDAQIRPRSGLASRGVLATFGTVDADYRGELLVALYTVGQREPHVVHDGDRIAQLVLGRADLIEPVEVESLTETERGALGHGSTGR
jgi:dUTP pyrophosphatase